MMHSIVLSLSLATQPTRAQTTENQTSMSPIRISNLEVEQSEDHLVIEYQLTNISDDDVHLVNRLWQSGPTGPEVDVHRAYVRLINQRLVVRKGVIPVPEDIDVEYPEVPYLTRLEPGESFYESMRLALPIVGVDPYTTQMSGNGIATELVVIFGYCTMIRPTTISLVNGPELWEHHLAIRDHYHEVESSIGSTRIQTGIHSEPTNPNP